MEQGYELKQEAQDARAELIGLIEALCAIPAPLKQERARAEFVCAWLEENGLPGAQIDRSGNAVYAYDCAQGPYLVFSAHMDTVFPDTEPFSVAHEGSIAQCPGIGDDTANMAAMLLAARRIVRRGMRFPHPLLFAWDTGEEGLGNLRGARGVMEDHAGRVAAWIALDSVYPGIIDEAVGSVRWRITAKTAGGHSFRNFGSPNAIACMAGLVEALYGQRLPEAGRATFNAGGISGGTSVNTIAAECQLLYEARAENKEALAAMEENLRAALDAERARGGAEFTCEVLGRRPAGGARPEGQEALEAHWRAAAAAALPGKEVLCSAGSTDCNIPLSQGIPAMCVGTYRGGAAHTRAEWIDYDSLATGYELLLRLLESLAEG